MSGPALAPIITPPVAALAGLVAGRFIDLSGEGRRWKRDQRAKAYADFIGCADSLFAEVAMDAEAGSRDRALASFLEMTRAGAMVDVFGSQETADAAHQVWNRANDWISDWERISLLDGPPWEEESRRYRELLLEVTNSVRTQMKDKRIGLSVDALGSAKAGT